MALGKGTYGKVLKTIHIELVADDPRALRDALISHGWAPVAGSTRVERTDSAGAILRDLQHALPSTRESTAYLKSRKR